MVRECEEIELFERETLEENEKWLLLFEESMEKLSDKTIQTHMGNVDYFINYYCGSKTPGN